MKLQDYFKWFKDKPIQNLKDKEKENKSSPKKSVAIPPGRTSVPEDDSNLFYIKDKLKLVKPSFRVEMIKLLRDIYKVNPDAGIAVQDMFKLANTGHKILFPYNTDAESKKMREHLQKVSKKWASYTAGIDGLVNKFIVQCYITGSISLEAVPNQNLDGLSTVVLLKPENIRFNREKDGIYQPYQLVKDGKFTLKNELVKLNPETFIYVSMFNDADEPYGIPPFMTALDSLDGQASMKTNFKTMMDQSGLLGFMEATIEKSSKKANESESTYIRRLESELSNFKTKIKEGMSDGVIVGHTDDHQFKFNSTTKDMGNVDKFWNLNQQQVANGLGVSGNILGIASANTEGGAGILLSKMISQLKNIQMLVSDVLTKIYMLELRLAGFKCKTLKVIFGTSTISDELKVQQGKEIKLRNLVVLYNQGIISQHEFAFEAGYDTPDKSKPRVDPTADQQAVIDKEKREKDKDVSDRSKTDKDKVNPKRADQDTRKRVT